MTTTTANNKDNNNDNNNEEELLLMQQSLELRERLEELMEDIGKHKHQLPVCVWEERYALLVSSFPSECLSLAVTLTDADATASEQEKEPTHRLPIHLACDKGAPLSIVRGLLQADDDRNKPTIRTPDKWGDLPIHTACSLAATGRSTNSDREWQENDADVANVNVNNHNDTVEIIRLLLAADVHNETLLVKDVYESLPLHTAARYNAPAEVVRMLLDAEHTTSLYTEGLHGQFPLTVACRSGNPSPGVLEVLLEYDYNNNNNAHTIVPSSTVLHKDATGRLPIHVFLLRNSCEACLRILLTAMLSEKNSILRLGLDAWRARLRWIQTGMAELHERDFKTRDQLDVISNELRSFGETGVVLEQLLVVIDNNDTIIDGIFDGAEIIVPNVLCFLEDEPVERIVQQFREYGYL